MYKSAGRSCRRAERPEFASDRASRGQGHVQSRRRTNASRITHDSAHRSGSSVEENSFALEFGRSSSKKASGKPIQTLIDEEVSKEMESRRTSPSVIAKLMGLDTLPPLPPQVAHKQRKNVDTCFQATSSTVFQGNFVPPRRHSCHKRTNEDQEFKDIFEVMETAKFRKHKNQSTRKSMQSSKGSQTDMDFIRQKFMDVKRLSTDEALQNSKEFDDALEILHSNKDLFLEFLQDNAFLAKHLQDVDQLPLSSHPSQITVLKSSKGAKCRNAEWSKSERRRGSCSHMQKEVTSSFRKSAPGLINLSLKEYSSSVTQNSSTPPYMGKTETHVHPTRIVVLKPSLEKIQNMVGPISFSHENLNFGSRKHREFAASAIQGLHKEGRDRLKFSENAGHLVHKAKGSREVAREIARQMRHTVGSHSKRAITSELKAYVGNENSCILSDLGKLNNSESFCRFPNQFDEWSNDFSPSSSYSTESSVSREARKRMSERWKMTHQFQDVGHAARGVSTLGEMLALSDRETLDATVVPLGTKKVSDDKFAGDEVLRNWDFPLDISGKNGWEDGSSTKLRRSRSLPAASTAHESLNVSYRKQDGGGNCYMLKDVLNMSPDDFSDENFSKPQKSVVRSSGYHSNKPEWSHSVGEENKLPELEIYVHSEELRKSIHVRNLSEEKLLHPARCDEPVADGKHLIDTSLVPTCENETSPLTTPEEHVKQFVMQLTPENEELSGHNHNDIINKEDLTNYPQVDTLLSQSETSETGLIRSSKECEQPSPISVLEPPSEEESSCSGCFERISADLQELRMQLKLLKLESTERYEEELGITISSDDDSARDSQLVLPIVEIHQTFRDEDDRDFSYLLDILIDSGIHGANQNRISDACYSLDYPVGPHVFDELEKKYGVIASWSRSERKLLFDLVNYILAGIVAPCIDLHPWASSNKSVHAWEHEGLVEGLWQMVVKQRKELGCNLEEKILDPRWLGVEDDTEVIVKEMERMLDDDLLEEIVTEFIIG